MKTTNLRTVVVGLITVAVVALGTTAFADRGMRHHNEEGDGGRGYHHRGDDCPYGGQASNLTDEQRGQLNSERQAFFEATRQDRQDLYAKRLELQAEMAKREPDLQKAASLQKEVSDLQANLDQKHLTHIMAMRKINPEAGQGYFMNGRGMGDHGMGMGMGRGSCRD